ncbi:PREDICTED: nudix hydrolase 22, chloroplastic [Camelina sativa]|uniref:Nudix hydrolase 22, chloroplastic n=1 Tax=Camelina sativa TaxID=90675 RepID=A0ABM0SNF0_CAMSA|nr:PREDICTED: nudix hydrolase 22, chloroplastic [Camelina sativa]
MKSATSATSPTATSFKLGSLRLLALAQQLRLYKPPLSSPFDEESTRKLVSHVGFQELMAPVRLTPKKAAVLICLFEGDDGDLRVILTKRSSTMSTHSGEVSLPGGKAEEHDKDDGVTATREAEEEIGLDPSLVDVVAFLEPFLSQHLLRVTPVVGILWDKKAFNPRPSPTEVEAVFDAPFEMFLKDENRRSEEIEWMGEKLLFHFFDYKTGDDDYVIWGLTSRILIRAATVVYQRPPAFIEQKPNLKYSKMNQATSLYG